MTVEVKIGVQYAAREIVVESSQTPEAVEDLITGERRPVEWGGLHVRIDPTRDPALLLRCLA